MRRSCVFLLGIVASTLVQSFSIDLHDQSSLQRGARTYMNYCSGCHSLKYLRYSHMATGLGLVGFDGRIDEDLLKNNLIFTQAGMNDPIRIALEPEDAKQWFGVVPPDLSLIAREKGAKWLYLYLKSFYRDYSRPFGTNNVLVPSVAMPNILESLAGEWVLVREQNSSHLSLVHEGELPSAQFDALLNDLVTFLVFVGEPVQAERQRLGYYVLAFLALLVLVVALLKREYWRDIHRS